MATTESIMDLAGCGPDITQILCTERDPLTQCLIMGPEMNRFPLRLSTFFLSMFFIEGDNEREYGPQPCLNLNPEKEVWFGSAGTGSSATHCQTKHTNPAITSNQPRGRHRGPHPWNPLRAPPRSSATRQAAPSTNQCTFKLLHITDYCHWKAILSF